MAGVRFHSSKPVAAFVLTDVLAVEPYPRDIVDGLEMEARDLSGLERGCVKVAFAEGKVWLQPVMRLMIQTFCRLPH